MKRVGVFVIIVVAVTLVVQFVYFTSIASQTKKIYNNMLSRKTNSALANSVRIPYFSRSVEEFEKKRYSKFRCVGNDNSKDNYQDRACVFMNVCYDKQDHLFKFYRHTPRPVLADSWDGYLHNFRQKDNTSFVRLTYFDGQAWAPEVVQDAMPTTNVVLHSKLHVLFRHWIPEYMNLGHFLWEDVQGAHNSIRRLGLTEENPIVMDLNGHDQNKLYRKWIPFTAGISGAPLVDFNTYMKEPENDKRFVCFEQLQAGGAMGVFLREDRMINHGKEQLFKEFRDNLLRRNNLDPNFIPQKHQILLTKKTSYTFKRSISNLAEVEDFIRKTYPTITVKVVDFSNLTIHDQLEVMLHTTIFITPCGGVSMMAPFLPHGAHAIFMDYFANKDQLGYFTGESAAMEGAFWNHWAHMKRNYYQVREQGVDWEYDHPDADDSRWYASVIISLDRIKSMIDGALEDMEA